MALFYLVYMIKKMDKNTIPYTYLIGWSKLNKWYYGVRYAKGCNPEELWKSYFTSSKYVKFFRKINGEPDIIEIRKIFNDTYKALLWEQKLLKRIDVENNENFLNRKNSTTSTIITNNNKTSFRKGNIPYNKGKKYNLTYEERKKYGRIFTKEEKENLSLINIKRFENDIELKNIYKQNSINMFKDDNIKKKHLEGCIKFNKTFKSKIWINNGKINKRIYEKDLFLYKNWKKGRFIPDEVKNKMKQNRKNLKDIKTGKFIKGETYGNKN